MVIFFSTFSRFQQTTQFLFTSATRGMCSVANSEGGGGHGVLGLPLVQRGGGGGKKMCVFTGGGGGGGNKSSDFIGGHILPAAIRLAIRRALT